METNINKKLGVIALCIPLLAVSGCSQQTKHVLFEGHVIHRIIKGQHFSNTRVPTKKEAKSVMTVGIVQHLGGINQLQYNGHGAFVINNNQNSLDVSSSTPYATTQKDQLGRTAVAEATLNLNCLGKGPSPQASGKPLGYHVKKLNSFYKRAFTIGTLLPYSIAGGVPNFSTTDPSNLFTQTEWAAKADSTSSTGKAYYDKQVKEALMQGKIVHYKAINLYSGKDKVPMGTQLQAKSNDGSLQINVFVPNIQSGIGIDYGSGIVTRIN